MKNEERFNPWHQLASRLEAGAPLMKENESGGK
jgi:hypothetical protein